MSSLMDGVSHIALFSDSQQGRLTTRAGFLESEQRGRMVGKQETESLIDDFRIARHPPT
jgi:hypothetical protein